MRLSCALLVLLPLSVGTQTTAEATTVAETTEAPNATTAPFTCSGVGSNTSLCEEEEGKRHGHGHGHALFPAHRKRKPPKELSLSD